MDRNKGLAFLFIAVGAAIGASILVHMVPVLGHLAREIIGYLIPIAMIVFGYYGVISGSITIGWIAFILGLLMLIGKFAWLIVPLVAIGLIIFGIGLLRGRGRRY